MSDEKSQNAVIGCGCLLIFLVIVGFGIGFGIPAVTPEATATAPPAVINTDPLPGLIGDDYRTLDTVTAAQVFVSTGDAGTLISGEVVVVPGANTEATAAELMRLAMARTGAFITYSVILDDCTEAIDYIFENDTDTWSLTPLGMTVCGDE